jgi:hypothetical protein
VWVLRASVITTDTSRIARLHDTITHKPYCPPPADPFTLVGASRQHNGHLSGIGNLIRHAESIRSGRACLHHVPPVHISQAPGSCQGMSSPQACMSLCHSRVAGPPLRSHSDKVRARHCHTILWSPCVGIKSIWQAQGQCLFLSCATRNMCSLASIHSTPCHPPLRPIITLGAEGVQVTGPGRSSGMI